MKYLSLLSFLGLSFLVVSCRKNETPSAHCANATVFVKSVNMAVGRVYYDSTQQAYSIQVPNSFDSDDVGYACNLPANYQLNGLKVQFSGSYYEYGKTVFGVAGNKYYYLSLDSIALR